MAEFLEGIEGYNDVEINTGNKPKELIPGAYVLKITNAKVERFSASKAAIKVMFDIDEGEFKGYFGKLYEYNCSGQYKEQAKWKGVFNIWLPQSGVDEEQHKKDIASFKRAITAINDSNPQKIDPSQRFSTDSFKGKKVGGAFGLVDWEWDGKSGTRCECRWLVGADRVRSGDVETPAHKGLKGAAPVSATAPAQATSDNTASEQLTGMEDFEVISDGDIPF